MTQHDEALLKEFIEFLNGDAEEHVWLLVNVTAIDREEWYAIRRDEEQWVLDAFDEYRTVL